MHVGSLITPIHPDGHGIWTRHDRTVPFFLEYDTGTEALTELLRKIAGYERLAINDGPRWPVLFRLHATDRQTHLHRYLTDTPTRIPIATAVLTDTTPPDTAAVAGPAGRCWWLHRHPNLLTLAEFTDAIPGLDTHESG